MTNAEEHVTHEGRADIYANNVRIDATVYDFALRFGVFEDNEVRELAAIRMSPHHAKSLLILLERFVTAFEKQVSPVELPDELIAHLKGEGNDAVSEAEPVNQ